MIKKYSDRRLPRLAALVRPILTLAAIAALLLPSCARKSPDSGAAGRVDPKAALPSPAAPPASRAIADLPRDSSAPESSIAANRAGRPSPRGEAAKAPPAALAASLRAFGLGARPEPRMPRDFSLGPLQAANPRDETVAAVLGVAEAFLSGVAEGKIDPSLFLPEAREALSILISPPPAEKGAVALPGRVGAIELDGSAASLRVRLPAARGSPRLEGLLSLRREGNAWYVESLALDPPVEGSPAFEPGAA